jgi:2-keto-4-pentenoate hydratase/2-oxohepta-3-ene-1,7-dioic acid hydratase in catechol pathway
MKIVRFIAESFSPQPMWGMVEGDTVFGISLPTFGRTGQSWRRSSLKMLPPANPTKIVCVGKNYAAHAAENRAYSSKPQTPWPCQAAPSRTLPGRKIFILKANWAW